PRRERATVGTSRSDSQPESRGPRRVHGVIVCRHSANKYRLNLWYRNRDPTTSSQTCRQTRLKDETCLKRYENLASSRTRRVIDINLEDKNRPKRRDVFHFGQRCVQRSTVFEQSIAFASRIAPGRSALVPVPLVTTLPREIRHFKEVSSFPRRTVGGSPSGISAVSST
ncbi:hypothetical protein HN011_012531, partial [Eciton burchellii]